MTLAATLGTLLLVALAASSTAANDPLTDCNDNPDPAIQIRGCTDYIAQAETDQRNLAVAYVNRAIAYSMTEKSELALSDYAKAIELDPENPLPYYNRGNLYLDTGHYDLAIIDFTAAIKVEPLFALAYYNRGLAYEHRGDKKAAREDYQRTLKMDPSHKQAQSHLNSLRR